MTTQEFFESIFGTNKAITLTEFFKDGQRSRKYSWQELTPESATKRAEEMASEYDTYFRTTVLGRPLESKHERGKADETSEIVCFWGDFDFKDEVYDRVSGLEYLRGLQCPPSIVVLSGGGYHAYWLLNAPWSLVGQSEVERAQSVMRGWTNRALFGADSARSDLASVLRVPGTLNRKRWEQSDLADHPDAVVGQYKYSEDDQLCRVVESTGCRYALSELMAMIPSEPAREAPKPVNVSSIKNADRRVAGKVKKTIEGIAADIAGAKDGDRNKMLTRKCARLGDMVAGGLIDMQFACAVALSAAMGTGMDASEKSDRNIERLVRRGGKTPMTAESILASLPANNVPAVRPTTVAPPASHTDISAHADPVALSVATKEEDPEITEITFPILPSIKADILPFWAADYIWQLSEAKEVDPTFGILLCLSAIASTVQRKYYVRVENSYSESLCLFTACCLPPGERKTAIQGAVIGPILAAEREYKLEAESDEKANGLRRKLMEKRIAKLEMEFAKAEDENDMANVQDAIEKTMASIPKKPPEPQFVIESFTEAALCQALVSNNESLFASSSEGGIFSDMCGRFSERPEMDLVLKAHTGETYRSNRIGRGNNIISRPLLSVAISPQPGVLNSISNVPEVFFKGLAARFAWAFPRSMVGGRALEQKTVPQQIKDEYTLSLKKMTRDGFDFTGDIAELTLTQGAYETWKAFEREIEPRMGKGGDLSDDKLKGWASKLPGLCVRMAAVSHCATMHDTSICETTPIDESYVIASIEICRALIPHTKMAFGILSDSAPGVAESVVDHFTKSGWPTETLSQTEWWRRVQKIVGSNSKNFAKIAEKLVDAGYFIPVKSVDHVSHGRFYRANRRLFK